MVDADARRIANEIVEGKLPEAPLELYTSDLVVHSREFSIEADIVKRLDGKFPCIRRQKGVPAPISFSAMGIYRTTYGLFPWYDFTSIFQYQEETDDISFVSVSEARENFKAGMISFLNSRIRSLFDDDNAVKENRIALHLPRVSGLGFSTLRSSTSGFKISVSAATSGLRIHSSPTFRRSWSYFGSPTSPIKGALPGGIYEFGADGGGYSSITPDSGAFDIPYKTVTPSLTL